MFQKVVLYTDQPATLTPVPVFKAVGSAWTLLPIAASQSHIQQAMRAKCVLTMLFMASVTFPMLTPVFHNILYTQPADSIYNIPIALCLKGKEKPY